MITTNPCIASARKNEGKREKKEEEEHSSVFSFLHNFFLFFLSLHRVLFKTFFTEWNGRLMENDNVSILAMIDDGEIN